LTIWENIVENCRFMSVVYELLPMLSNKVMLSTLCLQVLSLGEGNDDQKQFICLNPGRLAKGIGGGTFVELYYHEDTSRTNASIIRI
jgi:hypothetical protein